MHRYEELEKLYYKKLYIKYFIYFIIFGIIIFISSFIYFTDKQNKPQKIKEFNKTIKIIKKVEKSKKQKKVKTKPFVKKLTLYPIYPNIDINSSKHKNKIKKIVTKSKPKPQPQPKKEIKKKESKKAKIQIIIKTETIDDLINIYDTNPAFNIGLKISNYYFQHKKYEESIKWCKKVNKIEPENYESWYLFAKNLIQLNKNKEAKKVLIYYLSNYGPNDKIEKLLRSIK